MTAKATPDMRNATASHNDWLPCNFNDAEDPRLRPMADPVVSPAKMQAAARRRSQYSGFLRMTTTKAIAPTTKMMVAGDGGK